MKSLLVFLAALTIAIHSQSQPPASSIPAPVNTNFYEMHPVLLPDSSLLLSSSRNTTGNVAQYKAYRFVKRKGDWVESPSHLDSMINSSTLASGIASFHFTPDFSMVLVKVQASNFKVRFFESHFEGGRWQPMEEFFIGNPKQLWGGLAIMQDHRTALATNTLGELFTFHKTDAGWSEPVAFKMFNHVIRRIDHLVSVGENGLLFNGDFVKSKGKRGYFLSKMTAPGKWTAPMEVEGVEGSNASPCWNRQSYLFASKTDDNEMDIRVAPLPPVLSREMVMKPAQTKSPPVAISAATDIPTPTVAAGGRYFAVLIGNADYKNDKLDLARPIQDMERMYACLSGRYGFDESNIVRIVNADRNTILKRLYALRQQVNASDNLLIFYAGHGNWDEHIKQGYWWPTDADPDNPATWISNSDLREQIRGLNTRHTLLISDACFSGGIFRMRGPEEIRKADLDIQQLYRLPSRRAITSGTLTSVPDESVFLKYMLKALNENEEKYLPSTQLFSSIRSAVMNNSLTIPQDGVILETGDEGGDFVFIRN